MVDGTWFCWPKMVMICQLFTSSSYSSCPLGKSKAHLRFPPRPTSFAKRVTCRNNRLNHGTRHHANEAQWNTIFNKPIIEHHFPASLIGQSIKNRASLKPASEGLCSPLSISLGSDVTLQEQHLLWNPLISVIHQPNLLHCTSTTIQHRAVDDCEPSHRPTKESPSGSFNASMAFSCR